ncbi:MAG: ATP-dependent DNA helicase RecG [Flavobacteriales bacterium]|nr:ATP-dependent DNA helicase RecG [Flavobacteriales bacterium]
MPAQQHILYSPIEYLKGVGPQRGELLKSELGIKRMGDLLYLFPFRYIDRTQYHKIRDLRSDVTEVQLVGRIVQIEEVGHGRQKRLVARFEDETGQIDLVWFQGGKWIKSSLQINERYVVFGKPKTFKNRYNIPHPELEKWADHERSIRTALQPVYPSTEKLTQKGLHSKGINKLQDSLWQQIKGQIGDTVDTAFRERHHLIPLEEALLNIHFPRDLEKLEKARFRLKFEELFFIQLGLVQQKNLRQQKLGSYTFEKIGPAFNEFYEKGLPFELTGAQKRVLKEIRRDVGSGHQMNRLLQGDVGSGKTIVALMAMLMALDNGYQACLMAPTEILAQQHYQGLNELIGPQGHRIELLTGSVKTAARKPILADLASGELLFIVGTHALLEDPVVFKNLGLVVIDEQHRFGVAQRAKMWKKSALPPHVLVMTATPIPRTLAMSLYGDLDSSVIDELPPGRKEVKTVHRFDSNRMGVFQFMKAEIEKGRQVYVVYPLIKESEKLDYKDLMDGYESIVRQFPLPDYRVAIVHGQMKAEDKEFEMQRFVSGQAQIMVATTVIEVGVNVPNASVMIIQSAERFGLSQLHQLRGRVGRGADQSYCILLSKEELSNDARVRLETMVRTTDGFVIAEVDMQLRGPGDMMGTQQSGLLDLQIADVARDGQIMALARRAAEDLLRGDSELEGAEFPKVVATFKRKNRKKLHWSRIS